MNLHDLESSDQRKAAIHECAHALVARHYGVRATPSIWHTETNDPITEKAWGGRVQFHGHFQTFRRSRRVAIAGYLAELMDAPHENADELENRMMDTFVWGEDDGWSASDIAMAQGWTSADFRAVHSILKRKWKTLLQEMDELTRQVA